MRDQYIVLQYKPNEWNYVKTQSWITTESFMFKSRWHRGICVSRSEPPEHAEVNNPVERTDEIKL